MLQSIILSLKKLNLELEMVIFGYNVNLKMDHLHSAHQENVGSLTLATN